MKALLLAAGLGTRLRPLTDTIPKCLVPINGKVLLEYWLENLIEVGVNEILINTSYLSEQVNDFINHSIYKQYVTVVHEDRLLNTGGTVLSNKSFFGDEPFLLIHADNLSIFNFKDFIDTYLRKPSYCEMTMMLFNSDNPTSCGIVKLDEYNVVQEFHEKVQNPPSTLANAAVYICSPNIFKFLESLNKEEIDFSTEVVPKFVGKINTYLNNQYHRDIGTIESYAISQIEILSFT